MIFLGAMFDFLDGFVARALHVINPIGKDLDSLADIITFGLAPSFIAFKLIDYQLLSFVAFLIVICAALRLATYNNDPEQKYIFKGLPTPAVGLFWASYALAINKQNVLCLDNMYLIVFLILLLSMLMVLPIKMISFKFKNGFAFRENVLRYSFLLLALILIVLFKFLGFGLSIVFYIILSVIFL